MKLALSTIGNRVSKLQKALNATHAERLEREARDLVGAITDAELADLLREAEAAAPAAEVATEAGPATWRERAGLIFEGHPDLLARCRERIAAASR